MLLIFFNLYAQDGGVVKYLTWKPHPSVRETKDFLNSVLERIKQKGDLVYVIEKFKTKEIVGMIDIKREGGVAVCGYVIGKKFWGKGFMTEAVSNMIKYIFNNTDVIIFKAFCDIDNIGSKRVLEKSGLDLVDTKTKYAIHPNISNDPRDCYIFSIHRNLFFDRTIL